MLKKQDSIQKNKLYCNYKVIPRNTNNKKVQSSSKISQNENKEIAKLNGTAHSEHT